MLFSAYQIESLLEDIQQEIFPIDKSASETMSLSEDAIEGARQYLRTPKNHALAWINPGDIKALVEDQTAYDPLVDQVQQSRAGRFVVPVYVPENPAPSFPLVSDHTKALRESDASQEQTPEMSLPEKDTFLTDESLENPSAEDFESDTDAEELVQDAAVAETEISGLERITAEESTNELAEENIDEQTPAETEESNKSTSAKTGVSAASLFDGIEVEDDQDADFDFDMTDMISALGGSFTLSTLFAGASGMALLVLFATGALGLSFPWPGPQHFQFIGAVIYGSAKLVGKKLRKNK